MQLVISCFYFLQLVVSCFYFMQLVDSCFLILLYAACCFLLPVVDSVQGQVLDQVQGQVLDPLHLDFWFCSRKFLGGFQPVRSFSGCYNC